MPGFRMAMPYELDVEEIIFYHKSLETDEHCGGVDIVSKLILNGAAQLWVFNSGKDDGDDKCINVTVTKVLEHPDGYRELLVWMMAGKNVTSTGAQKEMERGIMEWGVITGGCDRMIAYIQPHIWQHFKDNPDISYEEAYMVVTLDPGDIQQ